MPAPQFQSYFLDDWRSWDGLEVISYETTRLAVPPPDKDPLLKKGQVVPTPFDGARVVKASLIDTGMQAKRFPISGSEKSPSGGAYEGFEIAWKLSQSQFVRDFAPGFSPKPGDVVIDNDQNRWTVQRTKFIAPFGTWRLDCLDLVLALDLRESINIERPVIEYDAAGSAIKKFPTGPGPRGGEVLYSALQANVLLERTAVEDERALRGFQTFYSITVEREIAVAWDDRVVWRGQYLDLVNYHNSTMINELPKLDAVKKP